MPHHLLSVLDPLCQDNTVHNFRSMALPLIQQTRERGITPVLVGGTHYYLEALLWDFLFEEGDGDGGGAEDESDKKLTNEALHAALEQLDPSTAARLHPNCRRKVCARTTAGTND